MNLILLCMRMCLAFHYYYLVRFVIHLSHSRFGTKEKKLYHRGWLVKMLCHRDTRIFSIHFLSTCSHSSSCLIVTKMLSLTPFVAFRELIFIFFASSLLYLKNIAFCVCSLLLVTNALIHIEPFVCVNACTLLSFCTAQS